MLILTRKERECVVIDGGRITICVIHIQRGWVKLGITAPENMKIDREEVHMARKEEQE